MGFYCSCHIVDGKNKSIQQIYNNKGGGGWSTLIFKDEDMAYTEKFFGYRTTVEKGLQNLAKVKELIKSAKPEILDEWSKESLRTAFKEINELAVKLQPFINKGHFVLLDKREAMPYVDKVKGPSPEPTKHLESIAEKVKGFFNGVYLSAPERVIAEQLKQDIKNILERVDFVESINDFGTTYEPTHLILEKEVVLFMIKQIKVKEEFLNMSSDGFIYNADVLERRLQVLFKTFNISLRRVFRGTVEKGFEVEFVVKLNNKLISDYLSKNKDRKFNLMKPLI